MKGVELSVLVALGAGLLSFLSPCVLPLVPSYLAYIAGISFDDFKRSSATPRLLRKVILNSLLFIAGFSAVFMTMGFSFSLIGQVLIRHQEAIRMVAGVLIAFFGLYISGALEYLGKLADFVENIWARRRAWWLLHLCCRPLLIERYLTRTFQMQMGNRPAGYVGSTLVGFSFAVGWTPCVGPILGAILALASSTAQATSGLVLLGAYSAGLGIPFLLSSLAVNSFLHFFAQFKRYIEMVHVGGGLLLIAVGILIFTGYLTLLNTWAIQLTPAWLWERL
ncbi:MAG: cytochrome c biogenesis protein CcdA [Nitrospinae bacterium]|nr:cytochrome c biogenesis protein CcdA [Nitrospinota bacterium]